MTDAADALKLRVIPAWAGNTHNQGVGGAGITGHPRVGGEHASRRTCSSRCSGSSPRGRGTLTSKQPRWLRGRVIPAWAGNTHLDTWCARLYAGHPRVGGEHDIDGCLFTMTDGSSPRGRGTLSTLATRTLFWRVIPAWAGNTGGPIPPKPTTTGHPRVGGEHHGAAIMTTPRFGSSPRGRGTPS